MMTHSSNETVATVQCRKYLACCAASFCAACGSVMALKSTDSKISVMHGIFITFTVNAKTHWSPGIFQYIKCNICFYSISKYLSIGNDFLCLTGRTISNVFVRNGTRTSCTQELSSVAIGCWWNNKQVSGHHIRVYMHFLRISLQFDR